MADVAETQILDLLNAKVEAEAVEPLFLAALSRAGIKRKPLYSPKEVIEISTAITEASYELLQEALAPKQPTK